MTVKRTNALIFIFITILVDVIGIGIIIPVVPKLIEELTGQGISEASRVGGWLMFSFASMQFLCSPIMGGLSDRFGRRPVLLLSLFGLGADYLFHAYAPTIGWLFIGRIIAGMMGASFTTATAYIADISTPEKRAQNFGLIGAAFGLGFIIGPVIGGVSSHWGPRVPFLVASGLTLLNVLYGYFVLPESLDESNRRPFSWRRANPIGSLKHLRKYPVVSGLIASLVCIYVAAHAVQSNWSFYCMYKFGWDSVMVGYSLAVVGVLVAAVQGGLIRIIIPKTGQQNAVYIGIGLYAVGFMLFGMATQSWMMFAFLVPYCLGGIAGPALQGIISSQVPPNEQGELQGALTSLMSLTSIFGPLLMNNIFAYFTSDNAPFHLPGASFFVGGLLTVLSLVLAMRTLSARLAAAAGK
jgi:DHA1 family tetracycline resistance protein-like MFS transporter